MVEIEIPFNKWSKDKLMKNNKWATSRNKKYGEVGDTFVVDETTYELDFVIKLPLWFIAIELFESEGCLFPNEFREVWAQIHPRKGYVGHQMVWYHHFG